MRPILLPLRLGVVLVASGLLDTFITSGPRGIDWDLGRLRKIADSLPVVLVNVTGGAPGRTEHSRPPATTRDSDWAELVDELGARPGDHLVTKQRRSAFHDTGLDAYLRGLGVTQVVLAGISTTAGVESTARSAFDYGYHVVLAIDAMTDTDADAHANSVARIFP